MSAVVTSLTCQMTGQEEDFLWKKTAINPHRSELETAEQIIAHPLRCFVVVLVIFNFHGISGHFPHSSTLKCKKIGKWCTMMMITKFRNSRKRLPRMSSLSQNWISLEAPLELIQSLASAKPSKIPKKKLWNPQSVSSNVFDVMQLLEISKLFSLKIIQSNSMANWNLCDVIARNLRIPNLLVAKSCSKLVQPNYRKVFSHFNCFSMKTPPRNWSREWKTFPPHTAKALEKFDWKLVMRINDEKGKTRFGLVRQWQKVKWKALSPESAVQIGGKKSGDEN